MIFGGQAEEAINLYVSLFDDAEILKIRRHGPGEAGEEGAVRDATVSLSGQTFVCIDRNVKRVLGFMPAVSLCLRSDTEEDIHRLFEELSRGSEVDMPLDAYPLSEKDACISKRYGVSWELSRE